MDEEKIEFIFTYHPPTTEMQAAHREANDVFLEAAKKLNALMPKGPGHTVAIRKLSEARMATHAAIALRGEF
jgi:hypothetical protein